MNTNNFAKEKYRLTSFRLYGLVLIVLISIGLAVTSASRQEAHAAEISTSNAIVSDISSTSGRDYVLSDCGTGDLYYTDRNYHFTGFSQADYDGLPCIRTANDDKDDESEDLY